jgi:hypothetical protein
MVNGFHADAVALCHCSSRFYYAIFDQRSGVKSSSDEVGGGGIIRGALSRPGRSRPSAVNTEEWRALSSHFG